MITIHLISMIPRTITLSITTNDIILGKTYVLTSITKGKKWIRSMNAKNHDQMNYTPMEPEQISVISSCMQ